MRKLWIGVSSLVMGIGLTIGLGWATAGLLLGQLAPKPPGQGVVVNDDGTKASAKPADAKADDDVFVIPGVAVKAVQAPVTVLDHQGHIVNGLNALDFQLLDNGKPQNITEDLSSHPISLVVVVQANAGMEHVLPDIRKIGSLFDGLVLGDEGEIAVVAFDHRVQVLTNFTSDPEKIHNAFAGKDKNGNYLLKAGSWTSAVNDAVMESVNMLRNRPANRKRIIVLISESRDQGSGMHVRDVLTAQEFANVVVYPVDVSHLITSLTATPTPTRPNTIPPGGQFLPNGQVMTPTLDNQINNNGDWTPVFKELFIAAKAIFVPNPLEVYSRYTGGREFPFYTQKGLEQAISNIGDELHNQYILTYTPNDQSEAGYHTIKVTVDRPDLKVFTREGYWLAAKPQ
jgi:VWFA-related protein